MKMKRRALSLLLSLAVMVTFMPMMTLSVSAASKGGKTYIVTKEKNTKGDTVSYKYNKKGLVSKQVAKWTVKDEDSDTINTETTSYKYNKKNRISKETTKHVAKTTIYNTNKTTGKATTPQGTITTTDTYVTKYTYNKKGVATKLVTTATTVKSGSKTVNTKNRGFYGYKEMADGSLLADSYFKDGQRVNVFWTGAVNDAVSDNTETTTYVDNGNGTYKMIVEDVDKDANYTINKESDDDDNVTKAEVVLTGGSETFNTRREKTIEDKSVTTTTFKYDKKKRAKSAVSTTVATDGETTTLYTSNSVYSDGDTVVSTDNTVNSNITTTTSSVTEAYKYGKKGAKKITRTNNGISNTTNVRTYGLTNTVGENTSGGVKNVSTTVSSGADCEAIVTTVKAGGTKTVTTETKPYTYTSTYNGTPGITYTATAKTETKTEPVRYDNDSLKATTVCTYAYDKKGNVKSEKVSFNGQTYATLRNETFGDAINQFVDANVEPGETPYQEPEEIQVVVNRVSTDKSKMTNTVKKGSKRLKSVIAIGTSKTDRATPSVSGYLSGKVTYTLKAKKFNKKKAKNVELQQWILQNGELNGIVGL